VDVTVPRRIRLGEKTHLLEERRRGANSLSISGLQLVGVDTGEAAERAVESIAGGVSWVHVCASANLRREKTPAGSQRSGPGVITNWTPVNQQNESISGFVG
jgi:hypothetical protein